MSAQVKPVESGRSVAWLAFVLGIGVSIAANVAHTWHPSPEVLQAAAANGVTAAEWRPEVGAQISSAFYPLALLLTVEIVTRVRWSRGWWYLLARFGGTGAVALVAAVASYRHTSALLTAYGEDPLIASVGPLAVDGLMVVASVALVSMSRSETVPEPVPVVADSEPKPVPVAVPADMLADGSGTPETVVGALRPVENTDAPEVVLESSRAVPDEELASRLAVLLAEGRMPADAPIRRVKDTLRVGSARAVRIRELALAGAS